MSEPSGVECSDSAGKDPGHVAMTPRSLRGTERSAGPGCDLATGRLQDFLELLGGELFGDVALPHSEKRQLGCDPEPAVVLIEAACIVGPLPLGERGNCDRGQRRPFDFDMPDQPASASTSK
jgi:hypothetical protein